MKDAFQRNEKKGLEPRATGEDEDPFLTVGARLIFFTLDADADK